MKAQKNKSSSLIIIFSVLFFTSVSAETNKLDSFLDLDETITVPSTGVETIQDALDCLDDVVISPKATVTIEVTESTEDYDTVTVNHPNGDRIKIIGKCKGNAGEVCIIQFKPDMSGIVINNGHTLGLLDNFNLVGKTEDKNAVASYGILADQNSNVMLASNITVSHFTYGIYAHRNSYINTPSVTSEYNNNYGVCAETNSLIEAAGATIQYTKGDAIYACRNSHIEAVDAKIQHNDGIGVNANILSSVVVSKSSIASVVAYNKSHGAFAQIGSTINIEGVYVHDNEGYGLVAYANGIINSDGVKLENNQKPCLACKNTGGIISELSNTLDCDCLGSTCYCSGATCYCNAWSIDNSGGWENVSLDDTNYFDMNCEYRVYRDDSPHLLGNRDVIYPFVVKADHLSFDIANEESHSETRGPYYFNINYDNKKVLLSQPECIESVPPKLIQKRCKCIGEKTESVRKSKSEAWSGGLLSGSIGAIIGTCFASIIATTVTSGLACTILRCRNVDVRVGNRYTGIQE